MNFLSTDSAATHSESGWCFPGLEWIRTNDGKLHVQGVSEFTGTFVLASYRNGKQIDLDLINAQELASIALTVPCSQGTTIKLFMLESGNLSPQTFCWQKQF